MTPARDALRAHVDGAAEEAWLAVLSLHGDYDDDEWADLCAGEGAATGVGPSARGGRWGAGGRRDPRAVRWCGTDGRRGLKEPGSIPAGVGMDDTRCSGPGPGYGPGAPARSGTPGRASQAVISILVGSDRSAGAATGTRISRIPSR